MSVAKLMFQDRAMQDVMAERARQVTKEGWTPEHDDAHDNGCLAVSAGCYALHSASKNDEQNTFWREKYERHAERLWPFDGEWYKPRDPRSDLVRAGALILAEIERLDRRAAKIAEPNHE